MGDLKKVPVTSIRPNPVALRAVDKEGEGFLGLMESIRQRGFMGAITVRSAIDPETQVQCYELVDGLHRFTAAVAVGLTEIPVDVTTLDDDQVLEAQIMANVHRIETKPVEYTRQLIRIVNKNPLLTTAELATKLGKSPAWLQERMSLQHIKNDEIAAAVNEGRIPLANAYMLAKLPEEEQSQFVDRAITASPSEFIPAVKSRIKELTDAKRKGQEAAEAIFTPVEHLRKLSDIKEARLNNTSKQVCKQEGATTAEEGFIAALNWLLHVDSQGVAEQKAKDEARRAEQKAAKDRAAAEREARKAAKAADVAAKAAAGPSATL